jgi:predicted MFS family arabinose efflux permease
LLATATINFFNFVFWALFILYATRALGVRPGALGLVLGAASVGGVIGSVVTGRISRRIGVGPAFALGCVLFPAPLVLVPLTGGPYWTVLGCLFAAEFASGFGVMVLDISAATIKAALVPDRLRARVSGAYMVVNYGIRPVGAIVGGALGTWIGLRTTLWIGAAGAILGALWLLPSPVLRLRDLPEQEEAA